MRVTTIDFAALLKRLDPERRGVSVDTMAAALRTPRRGGLDGAIADGVKANTKRRRLTPPPETRKE